MRKSALSNIVFVLIPIVAQVFSLPSSAAPIFTLLDESVSGIASQNELMVNPPPASHPQNNGTMAGGVAWIDYDNDGDQDLFIPNVGIGPSRLFRNCVIDTNPADPCLCTQKFCDVSVASNISGILNQKHSTGVAVGDFDADGKDDLYVTNLSSANSTAQNTLLKNMGDGTFQDWTANARLGAEKKPAMRQHSVT